MTKQILKNTFLIFLIVFNLKAFGQTFEGWMTYKIEAHNPNPKMIPDSAWQKGIKEQFGDKGYMLQKYYYKGNNYLSEISTEKEKGYQAFNPKNELLYSWREHSDTAITVDSKKSMDEFVEFINSDQIETIMGIECKSIIVKSKMGKMTLWYNSNYFKMDAKLFKGHKYGHWEQILKKSDVSHSKWSKRDL